MSERTEPSSSFRRRWIPWVVGFAIWTLLGLLAASQEIAYRTHGGQAVLWGRVIARGLLDWYSSGVFAPFIIWTARRFPLRRPHLAGSLLPHLVACALFIALKPALYLAFARAAGWPDAGYMNRLLYADLFAVATTYWSVVAGTYALDYYHRYRERELRTAQLESRLARVQLDALRSQLQPHFLFNALNAVSALMHSDVAAADRMVIELAELLRHTLSTSAPQEVTLRDELRVLDRYLDIMRIRLGDRLRVTHDFHPAALDCLVPNLILQPAVENALRHGIGRSAGAGTLVIRAIVSSDTLELTVRDDGPGLSEHLHEGIGLRNTRLRLRQLYGERHTLQLMNGPAGGAVTLIRLPFHTTEIDSLHLVSE